MEPVIVPTMTKNAKTQDAPTSEATVTEATPEFDRKEFNRLVALVKNEMGGVVTDSLKKRPLYSTTSEEAVAKRDAMLKAFESFLVMVESIKKGQA